MTSGVSRFRRDGPPAGMGEVAANTQENVLTVDPMLDPGAYLVVAKSVIRTAPNKSSSCALAWPALHPAQNFAKVLENEKVKTVL